MAVNLRTPDAADQRYQELGGSEDVIPPGMYCYSRDVTRPISGSYPITVCPYWALDPGRERQDNGYCAHLKSGDWEAEGLSLLWDQIKECGIHDEMDEDVE